MRTWRVCLTSVLALMILAACAAQPIVTTPRTYQGAGAGAAVGAGAGALIDKDNRWRGAALGAALGGVLGGSLTEISSRAARESVAANQPVAYQTTDGWQRIEAVPRPASAQRLPPGPRARVPGQYARPRADPRGVLSAAGGRRPRRAGGPCPFLVAAWGSSWGCTAVRAASPAGRDKAAGTRPPATGRRGRPRLLVRGAHHGRPTASGEIFDMAAAHRGASDASARDAAPGDESRERPGRPSTGERPRPVRRRPGSRPQPGGRARPRHGGARRGASCGSTSSRTPLTPSRAVTRRSAAVPRTWEEERSMKTWSVGLRAGARARAWPCSASAVEAGVPTDQLRGATDRVLKVLQDPELKQPAKGRRAASRSAPSPTRSSTGRRRASAPSPATGRAGARSEREEFSALFADLVERSYIGKIEQYSGERVVYAGRDRRGRAGDGAGRS